MGNRLGLKREEFPPKNGSYYDSNSSHDNLEIFTDDKGETVKIVNHSTGCTSYFEGPGYTLYRKNGLPAVVCRNGDREWYDENGRKHRLNGPAIINGCYRKTETVYSHERDTLETFSRFVNCTEYWYNHGRPVTEEWLKENKSKPN